MEIRPVCKGDISRIAQLEAWCFSEPWSGDALLESLENPLYTFLSAWEGDTLLGYGGMYTVGGESSLTDLAVFPEYRKKGAGRAILRALLAAAEDRGADALSLEVRVSNHAARALYEREGFLCLGVRPGFYAAPREDAAIYMKKFPSDLSDAIDTEPKGAV